MIPRLDAEIYLLHSVIDCENFHVYEIMSQVFNVDYDDCWRAQFVSLCSYILIGNCGDWSSIW